MAIALRKGTNGQLQQIQAGESVDADKFERLSASGNLQVGSALGAYELQLGQTTSLVRAMGDAQVDGILEISDDAPKLRVNETDAGSDEKVWDLQAVAGDLSLVTLTDALGAGNNVLVISRTGTTIDAIDLHADVDMNSNSLFEVKTINSDAVYNNGNSTASFTWTLGNGSHQDVTLNADSVALTIDATNITGPSSSFTLRVKQDATGSRAITSASISGGTVYYTGTTEPTFPSGANAQCEMVCKFDGTDCVCQVTGVLTAWT